MPGSRRDRDNELCFQPASGHPRRIVHSHADRAELHRRHCTGQRDLVRAIRRPEHGHPGTSPPGCPVIDPIAIAVTFPPDGSATSSVQYSVPASCTATQLIVSADIYGTNGVLYAHGIATLQIIRIRSGPAAVTVAMPRSMVCWDTIARSHASRRLRAGDHPGPHGVDEAGHAGLFLCRSWPVRYATSAAGVLPPLWSCAAENPYPALI